jgi:hypothetical protein
MVNHSSSKWAWLSQPTRSFHKKQPNGSQVLHRSSNIPASRQDLQEPTMTRHVEHLGTLLPQYCRYLSHHTYQDAANAMSLLLNNPPLVSLATTTSTSTTLPTSPEKKDSNINRLLSLVLSRQVAGSVLAFLCGTPRLVGRSRSRLCRFGTCTSNTQYHCLDRVDQRLAKQLHAMIPFSKKTATATNNNGNSTNPVTRLSRTEGPLAGDSLEALPA